MSARFVGLALVGAVATACASAPAGRSGAVAIDSPPEPMASLSPAVARTVSQLEAALATAGYRLDPATRPFRPSEPASLMEAPRAVLRASLAEPDAGHMLVYDLGDAPTATVRAAELASYLGSGFGQANYPSDARFAVAIVGQTVVFAWWSPGRADDRAAVEAAFEAVDSVGEDVPVVR